MATGGDENINGKEANCFYLTVPKLHNLKNKHEEKSEIIIHLAKKNYGRNKKRQLKLTNIKLTQNNKSKIETKTTSKNRETKKTKQKIQFSKKEINVIRQVPVWFGVLVWLKFFELFQNQVSFLIL